MQEKTCSKCQKVKPYSDFNKEKSRKDGLQVYCKTCLSEYRKTQDKDKIREEQREYRERNKERILQKKKEYRERNKESILQKKKEWKREKREELKRELLSKHEKGEELTEEERKKVRFWTGGAKMTREQIKQKKREGGKLYREKNKDIIRGKVEAKKEWSVYQINFANGCYYIGSSNSPNLRFNSHKSRANRGKAYLNLKAQDWDTANYNILQVYDSEQACLDAEYNLIQEKITDTYCLNTTRTETRTKNYWVYVIQSEQPRYDKQGNLLQGFFYVGMTTDPARRLREHNGLYANGQEGNPHGSKYTSKHRPWVARACFGPYNGRAEALKAEYTLKRTKRGASRCKWSNADSPLCVGLGENHPWVLNPTGWKP